MTAASDRGRERIAGLFDQPAPGFAQRVTDRIEAEDIADLSAHLVKLRSEMRLLAIGNEALASKVARIESDFNPIATASLASPSAKMPEPERLPRQVYPAVPVPEEKSESAHATENFALELGSAGNVEELHELWEAVSQHHAEHLGKLDPRFGLVTVEGGEHRLLLRAGPISSVAGAALACSVMLSRGAACSVVSDSGETLVAR